jgi:PAS domain S-box-containing protein
MVIRTAASFSGLRCRLILPVLTAALPGVWLAVQVTGHTPPTGSAVLVLAASALATAVMWVSASHLCARLEALTATTASLADGGMPARTNTGAMPREIARLSAELDRLASFVESRVKARTTEFLDASQRLQTLSRAVEETADSVFITGRDGVIEYVNPAFEAMTGYSRAEAVGQTPRLFASGLHDAHFYETLWTTILSGHPFRAIVTNKAKDGRLFNEDQTISPIRGADGTVTHFVSTGRDITHRRRAERALRRLNAALEDEAARIASALHDEAGQFLTSAHITLADVARDLPDEARERVQQVRRHLDQAEEQLRRVSHELHPRMLDDLGLTEAVRFLAHAFGRRTGITVETEVSVNSPCPHAVETVFYRLVQESLTNIAKHAEATRVWIVLRREDHALFCSVRDNGVGFDPDAVDRRDDFSLGLSVINDRLEAVGGTLTIVSAPQRGTELRASAPLES